MGVGLAICRAIVAAHGGWIRAENPASGGASVIFSLPRGEPPTVNLDDERILDPVVAVVASAQAQS